uniref:Endonuclease/exonuclease/phosphatase domain-containing protein n=1 Tax=Denticeps clupeoides TaxID=299321 RepID=A0AAY4CIR4_9TELE
MAGLNRSGLGSLRSVRWNIKGLHHPIKRCRIFSHLKALAPEILFLQETHLRVNEHSKLKTAPTPRHISLNSGGDFNLVLQPNLDRSNPTLSKIVSKSASAVLSFMESYKLFDPLRYTNPTSQQYSFFSSVHHSYSRIDFF